MDLPQFFAVGHGIELIAMPLGRRCAWYWRLGGKTWSFGIAGEA